MSLQVIKERIEAVKKAQNALVMADFMDEFGNADEVMVDALIIDAICPEFIGVDNIGRITKAEQRFKTLRKMGIITRADCREAAYIFGRMLPSCIDRKQAEAIRERVLKLRKEGCLDD